MNPADHSSHAAMPVRQTEIVTTASGHELEEAFHDMPARGKKVTVRLIGRAVRRHWWQALMIWAIGSIGLMALAWFKVKPTYIAFARVRVEPAERAIFRDNGNNNEFAEYKETQVTSISSPNVVETAITAHPELLLYPRLNKSDDPVSEIRTALSVMIVPKTNLIDVAMTSESALEVSAIVNAVVEAYLKVASDSNNQDTERKIQRLTESKAERFSEVEQKRAALRQLTNKLGTVNIAEVKGRNTVSVEQYHRLSSQLLDVELLLMKAEGRLSHLQNEQKAPLPSAVGDDHQAIETQLSDLFYGHPRVVELTAKFEKANDRYKSLKRQVRDPSDPALMVHIKSRKEAQTQLNALWDQLRPSLLAQIQMGTARPTGPDAGLLEAEIEVNGLKSQQASLKDKLDTLNIKQKEEGVDAITLEFDRMDLARAEKYLDTIQDHLSQLGFETRNPVARIRLEFPAKPSGKSSTSNRLKIMAMAPIGVLFGVLCSLVLLELHAGRVVDPEDIPSRVRVPVIGVVPPLPQLRPPGGNLSARDEYRTQRQLDQFVQSLDHLRVAICSGRNVWGRDQRCILITSAIASEGKTTLAAQLAERCVNAGLHTLLIDGDLRNPTLTRMLDVTSSRGLINVLRGDARPEEAIHVVGGAGGFSFMPAGTPKVDPSRLLHGEKLGQFLKQARETFDIVIVDAPPVLPVPDALTIGRWCDGAVIAVRYDMSRFPLVEKANRRLASVGVPVIGAVVNGVRVADSTYGSYYPSYAYSNDPSDPAPLDV